MTLKWTGQRGLINAVGATASFSILTLGRENHVLKGYGRIDGLPLLSLAPAGARFVDIDDAMRTAEDLDRQPVGDLSGT